MCTQTQPPAPMLAGHLGGRGSHGNRPSPSKARISVLSFPVCSYNSCSCTDLTPALGVLIDAHMDVNFVD